MKPLRSLFRAILVALGFTQPQYLVWSNYHKAWWGPNWAGYTDSTERAGRYPEAEALKIVDSRTPTVEHAVPEVMILDTPEAISNFYRSQQTGYSYGE